MKWQQIKSADGVNRRPSKGWRASRGTPGNAMSRLYLFSFFNGSSFNNLFSNNRVCSFSSLVRRTAREKRCAEKNSKH